MDQYFDYGPTSTVTDVNLNGNIRNIITALNSGLDNLNAATERGFRFVEILGSLPAAGQQGRIIFVTANNTLYYDTGSSFIATISLGTTPVQGDTYYFNGTVTTTLNKNTTSERYLANNGTSNNPNWDKVNLILGGEWEGQTAGDIVFASSATVVARLPKGTENQVLKVSSAGLPSWATSFNSTVYTGDNTFTAPGGVTKVFVSMIGGGGSGAATAGGAGEAGGGGSGASVIMMPFTVTPGSPYTVVVGDGGALATGGNNGNAGEASSFDSLSVNGGGPGLIAAGAGGAGGAIPTPAINAVTTTGGGRGGPPFYVGGNGAAGSSNGGGGGGTAFGAGTNGVTVGSATSPTANTGAGSGGTRSGSNGAAGASGLVFVQW